MFKVYLAGPIAGLTFQAGQNWRTYVKNELELSWIGQMYEQSGITSYSPLRGKEYLDDGRVIGMQDDNEHILSSARGVIARDGYDVKSCDLLFVNVDGVTQLSGGTAWELGVAWACSKVVVMVAANADNPYLAHLILSQVAAYTVPTLDEGIKIVKEVLLP